jgi:hypothetical protein
MKQVCPSCKEDALFVTDAVYDGFRKIGETRRCTLCGHVIRSSGGRSAPPQKPAARANPLWDAFARDETGAAPGLFDVDGETARLCRKCAHYVVNPFTQRCMLHDKEVEATDTCPRFTPRDTP